MSEILRQLIREQAEFRCEYCHIHEADLPFSKFHLDHIVARQHGGQTTPSNLAWTCQECNLRKGPNLSSIDPLTGVVCALFHPRKDDWERHFHFEGDFIRGKTSIGRATAAALDLNSADRLEIRALKRLTRDS